MSRLPEIDTGLRRYLTQQKRQANRASNASPYSRSGSSVTGEAVTEVEGQLQAAGFDGDLATGDAGTTGWAMNASRVAIGELFLRPGSVGNDLLANPVVFDSARASEYNFAVTTTPTERGYSSLVAPDGYTSALVTVFASLLATNDSGSTQYVYLRVQARNETSSAYQYSLRQQITLANGFWGTLIVPMIFALSVTPGDTIRGMGIVSASANMAADPAVVCDSELSVTFSR